MAKRYKTTGISKNLSYSINEIHDILGISPQTIRKYIKFEGLPAMTSKKPFLIHGGDLIAFLEGKRNNGNYKLTKGRFRCFTCGTRRRPFGDMADYHVEGFRPRLSALCGMCEAPVSLIVGEVKLAEYSQYLDIAEANPL